jgi:hypothetical protein
MFIAGRISNLPFNLSTNKNKKISTKYNKKTYKKSVIILINLPKLGSSSDPVILFIISTRTIYFLNSRYFYSSRVLIRLFALIFVVNTHRTAIVLV